MSLLSRGSRFVATALSFSRRRAASSAATNVRSAATSVRSAATAGLDTASIPRTFYFNPSRTIRFVAWCPALVLAGAGLLTWYNYEMTKLVWERMTSRKKHEVLFPLAALAILGTVFFVFGRIQGRRYVTQMDLIPAPPGALSPNSPYVRITTVGCPMKVRHEPMSIEEFMYHLPFETASEFDRVKGQSWIQLRDRREKQSTMSPKFVFNWELDPNKSAGVAPLLKYIPKGGLGVGAGGKPKAQSKQRAPGAR